MTSFWFIDICPIVFYVERERRFFYFALISIWFEDGLIEFNINHSKIRFENETSDKILSK